MKGVRVLSTGAYLPGEPLTNEDLERLVGPLDEDVLAGVSVQRRYWMVDPATGEHRENNSDMAVKAVKQALEVAGLAPEQVDLLVLSTATPDYPIPAVVNLVLDKLGLGRCATMEFRSGGAGWVQALDVARLYLEQGGHQTAVVIGSEAISPALVPLFLGKDPASIRMRDRLALYMFGDGAGAVVLQRSEEGRGIVGSVMACIGGGKKPGILALGGGTQAPIHKQLASPRFPDLRVDVVEAGRFTPYMITEALAETLGRTGVGAESIDLCLIPEGNVGWMLEALEAARLRTEEWVALQPKIFDNLASRGATGSAAVPIMLDDAWRAGRIKPGDRIMLVGLEATKWTYAGMILDWSAEWPAPTARMSGVASAT